MLKKQTILVVTSSNAREIFLPLITKDVSTLMSQQCSQNEFVPLNQTEVDALVLTDLALGIGLVEVW